jgi:hypothetical protein
MGSAGAAGRHCRDLRVVTIRNVDGLNNQPEASAVAREHGDMALNGKIVHEAANK